jgi:hypothetical protein
MIPAIAASKQPIGMGAFSLAVATLITMLLVCIPSGTLAEATEKDSALWGGGLFLVEPESGFDYSLEYQFRYSDDLNSLGAQFVEAMTYHKASPNLLLNGGYRFTERPDRNEHRLYLGGFLDLTKSARGMLPTQDDFRATLQIGYQHDFNTSFDDTIMDSNSIRWVLVTSRPATEKLKPFLLAGVLTTWNDAYSFGIDRIRLGGGVHYRLNKNSRLRIRYMWEKSRFRSPQKNTNIFWLRYERRFGH